MKQATLFKDRYPARARTDDPIQSHAAADRMNQSGAVRKQQLAVLRALNLHGYATMKHLDLIMPIANVKWDGWGHRRAPELEELGLITREKTGREMVCSLTDKGREVLRS